MAFRQEDVGTITLQILSWNSRRKVVTILNNGTDFITIHDSRANVAANGFPVIAGEVVTFTVEDGDDPRLQLYAVANSGTQDIRIYEGFGAQGQAFEEGA